MLTLGGVAWPYGPEAVRIAARPLGPREHRCRVTWPELALELWVDAGLPPPLAGRAPDEVEGPLAPVAAALRAAPPREALELSIEAPSCPADAPLRWRALPTARPALARAAALALAAARGEAPPPPASPLEVALDLGAPQALAAAAAPPAPQHVAWLDAHLVLFLDPGAPHAPAAAAPELMAALRALADPAAPIPPDLRGRGLEGRSTRERRLWDALAAAGLMARWPLGQRLAAGLCAGPDRDTLRAALREHDLPPLPCSLAAAAGARTHRGGAE